MKWQQIESALKTHQVADRAADTETFRTDAKARLSLVHQDRPGKEPSRAIGLRLATAALAAIVICGLWLSRPAAPPVGATQTQVAALTVDVEHAGVLIMDDASQDATIVWIADMADAGG